MPLSNSTNINEILSIHLDTVGDGTGIFNAIGDYSGGVQEFFIQPKKDEIIHLNSLIVTIEDTGGFTAQEYGNLGVALTNGIIVQISGDTRKTNILTDRNSIKSNAEWGMYTYNVTRKAWGAGNDFLLAKWTFNDSTLSHIILNGNKNDKFSVLLNDNLTGLITHEFVVQGHY